MKTTEQKVNKAVSDILAAVVNENYQAVKDILLPLIEAKEIVDNSKGVKICSCKSKCK